MSREAIVRFDCFGSRCAVLVTGKARLGGAELATQLARRQLRDWHRRFSRFEPGSELSLLSGNPGTRVSVTGTMARLAEAVVHAARRTGGLVDGTLVREIEAAGYESDLDGSLPLHEALQLAPPRAPGSPSPRARWREITVDTENGVVSRPVGVAIDSGGPRQGPVRRPAGRPAPGSQRLRGRLRRRPARGRHAAHGGGREPVRRARAPPLRAGRRRRGHQRHRPAQLAGREWRSGTPSSGSRQGRPAFTGIVQATALAPTALEAETLAKAALLSGPSRAREWARPRRRARVRGRRPRSARTRPEGLPMPLATSAAPHLFWITSRAAGSRRSSSRAWPCASAC